MMKMLMSAALSAVFSLLLFGNAAVAASRTLQRKAALRDGPGSYYPVRKRLAPGTTVDCGEVRGVWVHTGIRQDSGWLPQKAFRPFRKGIDYAGLLGSPKAVVISSVDIAAATKGAFEAHYSEKRAADFRQVDRLDNLQISPMRISLMLNALRPATHPVAGTLPQPRYVNNVIVTEPAERLLGRAMAATLIEPGLTDDEELLKRVNEVAAVVGMYSSRYEIPFRVAVIKDRSVGGFGIPGGYIVLTEGLLKEVKSEAELAGLLGHEMAHICLYHGLREYNKRAPHRKSDAAFAELDELSGSTDTADIERDLNRLADTSYMKIIGKRAVNDEFEADLYGAAFAADAGYDPRGLLNYLRRIEKKGGAVDVFRNHPPPDVRINRLAKGIRQYNMVRSGQVENTISDRNQLSSVKESSLL